MHPNDIYGLTRQGEADAAIADYPHRWELILVDDGSTDATLVNARKYVNRERLTLRIVELQRNFGQTAAMQAGIDTAIAALSAQRWPGQASRFGVYLQPPSGGSLAEGASLTMELDF